MRAARRETREAFQASRGVAILIVVIFHADLALASLHHYETFSSVRDALRFIPMPLFFLSVGMSLAPAFERGHAPAHLARRAVHYGYLFLVWTLVDIAVMGLTSPGSLSPRALVTSFVHPNNSLWFLYGLTLELMLFGAMAQWPKPYQIAATLGLVFLSRFVHSPLSVGTLGYMVFLVIGARYGILLQNIILWAKGWKVVLVVSIYIMASAAIFESHSGFAVFFAVAASLFGIVGLVGLLRWLSRFTNLSLIRYMGRSSFEIYILHSYFIMPFVRVAALFDLDVQGNTLLEIFLTFTCLATAVCGSLAIRYLIRNIGWLFSKPHWVVVHVEPLFVSLIEDIASFGKRPRRDEAPASEARPG